MIGSIEFWIWKTGMIESIQLLQHMVKKVNEIKSFSKKVNNILTWLIDLIESFELFWDLIESVHTYLVTWLNWLIYSSYTDSRWLNQYIFTFCHDWNDWFGKSRIQVCLYLRWAPTPEPTGLSGPVWTSSVSPVTPSEMVFGWCHQWHSKSGDVSISWYIVFGCKII